MEQRPISKLAVASLILSLMPIIPITSIIISQESNINFERFLGHYLSIILIIILSALIISPIPGFILGIIASRQIKRHNLKGKISAELGIILSIVVGLITLIVIPNITGHRGGCGNENSATSALKLLASSENTWAQQDCDGNDIKDYWTYDVSCLHRTYRWDNATKVAFIPIDMARADSNPITLSQSIKTFGISPQIENWATIPIAPKSGYWFQAMIADEKGMSYNQNTVGTTEIPATNNSKFAFVAYPDVYGISGIRTFIVNEEGDIYARDMKSDKNKIILQWPNAIEMEKWRIAD